MFQGIDAADVLQWIKNKPFKGVSYWHVRYWSRVRTEEDVARVMCLLGRLEEQKKLLKDESCPNGPRWVAASGECSGPEQSAQEHGLA